MDPVEDAVPDAVAASLLCAPEPEAATVVEFMAWKKEPPVTDGEDVDNSEDIVDAVEEVEVVKEATVMVLEVVELVRAVESV